MSLKQRIRERLGYASLTQPTGATGSKLKLMLDNKQKKWAFFAMLFFLILSLDDYSILTLHVPSFQELSVSDGMLNVKRLTGGKGGSDGDVLYIINPQQSIELRCRIGTGDESRCISINDSRFYDKTAGNDSWFGKSATIKSNTTTKKYARVWWYEANVFGFLKEKRLLQLDVEGERIVDYKQQKDKYLLKKSNHGYMLTILLILSIIWFSVLQLASPSLNVQKEK